MLVYNSLHMIHNTTHMGTMVLEYVPTFAPRKSPSQVGRYTNTMEHMHDQLEFQDPKMEAR